MKYGQCSVRILIFVVVIRQIDGLTQDAVFFGEPRSQVNQAASFTAEGAPW
jgi:hypothetical protein